MITGVHKKNLDEQGSPCVRVHGGERSTAPAAVELSLAQRWRLTGSDNVPSVRLDEDQGILAPTREVVAHLGRRPSIRMRSKLHTLHHEHWTN